MRTYISYTKGMFKSRRPTSRPSADKGFLRRHFICIILIVASIAAASLFVSYNNWQQQAAAKQLDAQQKADFAKIDAGVAARLVAARKAEAEAKAKAEADAKAKAAADASAQASAKARAPAPTTPAKCDVTNPNNLTVVVNKKHCFSPIDWQPSDLSSLDGYLLRAEAATHLTSMMNDAAAAGLSFSLSSSYRSYANQAVTYNNWVAVNGSTQAADTVSARPGYSEHQTGLAVDLKSGTCVLGCFSGTNQYQWLRTNAANYGFIERYPAGLTSITGYSPEAWHWRYVGIATATDMKAKGIETLEQYLGVTGGDYAG